MRLASCWAILMVNVLLILGGVWLGWTLPTLIAVLWAEAVVLVLLGIPLYIVTSQQRRSDAVAALIGHAAIVGYACWRFDSVREQLADVFAMPADMAATFATVAVLICIHEILSGLAERRRSEEEDARRIGAGLQRSYTTNGLHSAAMRAVPDVAPILLALTFGTFAVQQGYGDGAAYAAIVAAKICATLYFALHPDFSHMHNPPAKLSSHG